MSAVASAHPEAGRRASSGRLRLAVAVAAGLVVAVATSVPSVPRYGVLVGLMSAAAVYVAWSYAALRGFGGEATQAHANLEDPDKVLRNAVVGVVILGNLAAVVALLALDHGRRHDVDAGLALGSVVLSWLLLHTLFVSHYARLYYVVSADNPPTHSLVDAASGQQVDVPGGIDFNAEQYWPTYADFAYFGFNLGMTFQVSDTSVSSPTIRRRVLSHCLLSYFFATAITATVVNLVVGLVT